MATEGSQPDARIAEERAAMRYCPECACWRSKDMMDDGSYRCRVCGGAANDR